MHIYLDEEQIRDAISAWTKHRLRFDVTDPTGEGIIFNVASERTEQDYVAIGAKVEVAVPKVQAMISAPTPSTPEQTLKDLQAHAAERDIPAPKAKAEKPDHYDHWPIILPIARKHAPDCSDERLTDCLWGSAEIRKWFDAPADGLDLNRLVKPVIVTHLQKAGLMSKEDW